MTDNRAELLACPFCGGEPHAEFDQFDGGYVTCDACGLVVAHHTTKAGAIKAWNTRPILSTPAPVVPIEGVGERSADRQSFDAGWQYGFSDGMSEGMPGYVMRSMTEMFEEFRAALTQPVSPEVGRDG